MTPHEFVTWLRGFLDACGDASLTSEQVQRVREKLVTVATAPEVLLTPVAPTIYPLPLLTRPNPIWIAPVAPSLPFGGFDVYCGPQPELGVCGSDWSPLS